MKSTHTTYPVIILQKGKEQAVKRFHPWIFSGAIKHKPAEVKAGDLIYVADASGEIIGTGFFEPDSIAVKLLAFEQVTVDKDFFQKKLQQAFALRQQLNLTHNPQTTAYRLVHSEGDGLPGLIIDVYGKTAVLQAQSVGMSLNLELIASAIQEIADLQLDAIYNKSAEAMQRMGRQGFADGYLKGSVSATAVSENKMQFAIDWEQGQKTGFFIDQRENRLLLKTLSGGKKVLNTFSYSGGFSVAALLGSAQQVVSVDSSKKAIELCAHNIRLNGFDTDTNPCLAVDAKKYLEQMPEAQFDLIVLDPPAFAKNHHNRHKGLLGYRYINSEAIKKIAKGGLLFTFSCSQAVDRQAFEAIVMAASIDAGRRVRVLYHLSQPADHPVSIFHPEGAYLKGLVVEVQ